MVEIPVLERMGAKDDGGRLVIAAGMRALTAVKGGEPGKGCMTEDARQNWERVEIVRSMEYRVQSTGSSDEGLRYESQAVQVGESCALALNRKMLFSCSALQL